MLCFYEISLKLRIFAEMIRDYMRKSIIAILFLLCGINLSAQNVATNWAVADLSVSYLRSAPDYESSLETQVLMGSVLDIIGSENYWLHVLAMEPRYEAWVNELALERMDADALQEYTAAPKYICMVHHSELKSAPAASAPRISGAVMGDIVRQSLNSSGNAVVRGSWLEVLTPSGTKAYAPRKDFVDFGRWAARTKADGASVAEIALSMAGAPYLWGGLSVDGMDCSGLVLLSYFMNGILLPRNASQQAKCGVEVSREELEPGDLIFFGNPDTGSINHVGISLGGLRFIHSSQRVRISTLDPQDVDYYSSKPVLALRRIIGHVDEGKGAMSITKSPYYFKQ